MAVEQVDKQIYGTARNGNWEPLKAIARIVIISISWPIKDNSNNNDPSSIENGTNARDFHSYLFEIKRVKKNHPQAFSIEQRPLVQARPVQMQQKLKLTNFRQCLDIFPKPNNNNNCNNRRIAVTIYYGLAMIWVRVP